MQGYNLAEGRYENRTLSEDEMWSAFSNLFSEHSKNSSSYKFGFLKAIMDNLYNVDANLTLSFDRLFGTFAEVYWNLVLKHGIRQQPVIGRSKGTYLEQVLNATAARYAIAPNVPFESISDEAKLEVCKKIKNKCKPFGCPWWGRTQKRDKKAPAFAGAFCVLFKGKVNKICPTLSPSTSGTSLIKLLLKFLLF